MSKLHISDKLSLPIEAVTQKFGILGRTGSGKSYFATKLCEEMLDAKAQVVALDPVGVWWGLRLGDSHYSIPIFGGLHGDVPLEPAGGALIADLIVDKNISAVVDVSNFLMTEQRRFATDFATQLFHRKKSQRSALHVFFEEAQEFVPQQVRGDVAKMVGAFERLIKLGRNFGIGASLISQRPQSVNKDVLNQTECLVAFQMTGPQERETVRKWIAEKGVNEDIGSILPHLKVGEAHIWSPQWLKISRTVTIAQKKTADVSSTPRAGDKLIEPKQLSQIELEDLSDKMLATIERAKQEDPKELRKQIADLKRELTTKQPLEKRNTQFKTVEKPVLKDGQLDKLANFIGCIGKILRDAKGIVSRDFERTLARIDKVDALLAPINQALKKICEGHPRSHTEFRSQPSMSRRPAPLLTPTAREQPRPAANGSDEVSLGKGERACAIAVAQHPGGVTRQQLTTLTGYKRSTRNAYILRLQKAGYVRDLNDRVTITDAGGDWLGSDYETLPTGVELQRHWRNNLPKGESEIFDLLIGTPDGLSREAIGEATGFKRSTRNAYIHRLRARELVLVDGELIRPAEMLFQ